MRPRHEQIRVFRASTADVYGINAAVIIRDFEWMLENSGVRDESGLITASVPVEKFREKHAYFTLDELNDALLVIAERYPIGLRIEGGKLYVTDLTGDYDDEGDSE